MALVSDFSSDNMNAFSRAANGFVPRAAIIPFVQEKADGTTVLIKAGDTVHEGQVIAKGADSTVHATVPGTIEKIFTTPLPNGKQGLAAQVRFGGAFSYTGTRRGTVDWKLYSTMVLQSLLAENGVVNTFGTCLSLAGQIRHLPPKNAHLLVVRLFDDDPSRVTEHFIARQHAAEVAEGAAIIAKAMQAAGIVFAKPVQKKNASPNDEQVGIALVPTSTIYCDTTKYPAGTMHAIAETVKKQIPQEPFATISNRDLFIDAPTAFAAYTAVAQGTPLMERFVHVTGDCLNAAAILKVKIGTTVGDLAAQCGGFKRSVARIVINGKVMGTAISSFAIPVTKMVKSIEFLPARKAFRQFDEKCIRCGACRTACPVGLYPDLLYRSYMHGTDRTDLEKGYAQTGILCTRCGLCNAVCPSRLPLREMTALLKESSYEK